ncbi:hypothetical protein TB1_044795 [Malus domestica]
MTDNGVQDGSQNQLNAYCPFQLEHERGDRICNFALAMHAETGTYRITVLVHINVYCDRLSPDASEAIASTHRLCSSLQFTRMLIASSKLEAVCTTRLNLLDGGSLFISFMVLRNKRISEN